MVPSPVRTAQEDEGGRGGNRSRKSPTRRMYEDEDAFPHEGQGEDDEEEEEDALLRYRLAQLGYKDHLPSDAIPLVRRLFQDLVMTTDSARKFKHQSDRVVQEKAGLEEQIQPLRQEIGNLTDENNKVHMDIVRLADDRDARDRRAQQMMRRAEAELSDLRFMNTQYANRLAAEQKRSEAERARVEEAFGKMGLLIHHQTGEVVSASGGGVGKKKNGDKKADKLFQRLQKIDLETGLEPMDEAIPTFQPPDPTTIDLMKLSQARIDTLERTCEDLRGKNADLENEIQTQRDQLAKREQEIVRLGTQLEVSRAQQFSSIQVSGRPVGVARDDEGPMDPAESIHLLPVARERIEQLEQQVEHLLEQVDELEKERAQVETEKTEHAATLKREKTAIEDDLKKERQRNAGLIRSMTRLEGMLAEYHTLAGGSAAPSARASPFPSSPALSMGRVAQASPQQQQQNTPTQRRGGAAWDSPLRGSGRRTSPVRQTTLLNLGVSRAVQTETSANDLVGAEMLQSLLQEKQDRIAAFEKQLHGMRNEDAALHDGIIAKENTLKSTIGQLEHQNSMLKKEVEFLEQRLNNQNRLEGELNDTIKLKNELASLNDESQANLRTALRERDQLIMAIQRIEHQMDEMQESITNISSDRDNLAMMYEQVNLELSLLQRRGISLPKTKAEFGTMTEEDPTPVRLAQLLESETQLKRQVEHLRAELRNLESDLKVTSTKQREVGEGAEEAVRRLEMEKERLIAALEKSERNITGLSGEVTRLTGELETAQKLAEQHDVQQRRLREELEDARNYRTKEKGSSEDLRKRLEDALRHGEKTREEVDRLRKEMYEMQEKMATQRELMMKVDRDRDGCRMELDEKTEKMADMEDIIKNLTTANGELQNASSKLRAQLDGTMKALGDHEKTILYMQKQIEGAKAEREKMLVANEGMEEEIGHLKTDLGATMRENQILNGELAEVVTDRDRLQRDLADLDKRHHLLSDQLLTKDREKEQLFSAYRKIIHDHDRIEVALKSATEDANTLRMEVVLREKRIVGMQKELETVGREKGALEVDLGGWERKCGALTRTIATYERNARHFESERSRLSREVSITQDLAATLDRGREELQKKLAALTLDHERMSKELRAAQSEVDVYHNQMREEDEKRQRLETLVASERSQRVRLERVKTELEARVAGFETRIAGMASGDGGGVLARRAWMKVEEEKKELMERVKGLEEELRNQGEEFEKRRTEMEVRFESLGLLMEERDRRSLSPRPGISGEEGRRSVSPGRGEKKGKKTDERVDTEDPLEKRIKEELEITKRQVKTYEEQIEKRFKDVGNTP